MYKVRGYAFESLEQAQIAQKEVEKIRYIRSKTKMDDPDAVFADLPETDLTGSV